MTQLRKIIHIDMDCFYAAIEMRDQPEFYHKPLAVGGQAERRGVIATCNYIAREYGIHSAMSSARAMQLCPDLVIVAPRMEKYKKIAAEIRQIFFQFTDLVEPLSLDEAYLDVSQSDHHRGSATLIAQAIRRQIKSDFQLTASAGVASNKFLAKVASEWRKPDGLFVIKPNDIESFIEKLAIKRIHGVGKVTAHKLEQLGMLTCGQLQKLSQQQLMYYFSRFGEKLYQLCRGQDERPVAPDRIRKSLSVEQTFPQDVVDLPSLLQQLPDLIDKLEQRYRNLRQTSAIATVFIKLKFSDFKQTTVERKSKDLTIALLSELCQQAYQRRLQAVRLLGIGYRFCEHSLQQDDGQQLSLDLDG
jgi:DNA polymerase IV